MRILLVPLAAFLLATFAPPSLYSDPPVPAQPTIIVERLPLDPEHPARSRVGRLHYLGGWALRSNDARFGGVSALHVAGERVAAVSDAGRVFSFALPEGARAIPLNVTPVTCGTGDRKQDRDSESMAVAGGTAWLGFEGSNSICRYAAAGWRRLAQARPAAMRKWWGNIGAEAMIRLRDGRFLVFSEGRSRGAGTTEVLLFPRDPTVAAKDPVRLRYRPPAGYYITDAAELADGRLLFLNRRFVIWDGVSAKVTLSPRPPRLDATTILEGAEIADLRPPLTVDNMEGLSVVREGARTILWLASDDNFNPLQRNLLLKFALE